MGSFNARGQWLMGVGDGQVSVDNVPIDRGGAPAWLDDTRFVYQRFDGAIIVRTASVNAGPADRFANEIRAGGGVWAVWANDGRGIRSSTGFTRNPARLVDVSPDGAIAYINDSDWTTVRVREQNGGEWTIPDTPLNVRLLGNGRAVWHRNFVLGGRGIPVPVLDKVAAPEVLFVAGEPWLLYWLGTNGPLLLCPLSDPNVGYVVSALGESAWGFNGVALEGNTIRVGWARGAGEQPGEASPLGFVAKNINLTDARVDLRSIRDPVPPTPRPVPTPQPHPAPVPRPVPMTDHTDLVRAERQKYPATIDDPTCWAIVNAVCLNPIVRAEGWGLLKCPAGARGFVVNGQNYRVQRLCKPDGTLVQLLGSSGSGEAIAEWAVSTNDPNANAQNWAPPIGVSTTVPPPSVPPPIAPAPRPAGWPSVQQWCDIEWPQLVVAYRMRHGGDPSVQDAVFQSARRYAEGWTLERMLKDI